MIEHPKGEAEDVGDPNAFGAEIYHFAMAMKRRMAENSKKKKGTWQKLNPLNLLYKLSCALRDAQLSNEVTHWADVANYCMMMYSMDSTKRQVIADGPKVICFTVPSEVAATYVQLIKSQGLNLNVSKLSNDPKALEAMTLQIHQFFGQLNDALLPVAEFHATKQEADPGTNLVQKGHDPTQKPDKEGE